MNFRTLPLALTLGLMPLALTADTAKLQPNRKAAPAQPAKSEAVKPVATKAVPTNELKGDLTLNKAVEIALRDNPQIRRALQDIERTRGQIIEVRGQALPHLTLGSKYDQQAPALLETQRQRGSSGNVDLSGVDDPDVARILDSLLNSGNQDNSASINDKSWEVNLEVRQVLYSGGQVRAAINIANFTEDATYWQLRDTVDQVISKVRTQFAAVLLNRTLIDVQEQSVQLLSDQLKDQQNRFDAGTVPRFNVLQAEVALSNSRPDLIRARNNYLIAQLELAKSLGLPPGAGGKPSFNAVGTLDVPNRQLSLKAAIELGKERRPILKVQRQNILIELEQIKVALAGYKPRVDANGGYRVGSSRYTQNLSDEINGWFVGVTGSWAIFDGLETYGRTKQAKARLESAKVNYDDAVQQVELEVQKAYAGLQQARETIQSQEKGVEQAIEALRLSNERLAAGAGTQLDTLNANVALTRARTTVIQAQADYTTALAEFDRATATNTIYSDSFRDPLSSKKPKTPKTATAANAANAAKSPAPTSAKKP